MDQTEFRSFSNFQKVHFQKEIVAQTITTTVPNKTNIHIWLLSCIFLNVFFFRIQFFDFQKSKVKTRSLECSFLRLTSQQTQEIGPCVPRFMVVTSHVATVTLPQLHSQLVWHCYHLRRCALCHQSYAILIFETNMTPQNRQETTL